MSTTRATDAGVQRGRIDVTEQSLADVREFAAEAGSAVHFERRGAATYLVAQD